MSNSAGFEENHKFRFIDSQFIKKNREQKTTKNIKSVFFISGNPATTLIADEDQQMNQNTALLRLEAIPEPLLVDGGYSRSGHQMFIATQQGLITINFRVYDPIIGPIEYSEVEFSEITEIVRESGIIAENKELAPDEQLFLFNNGRPGVQYWAFQPYDNAPLEAYSFSSDKAVIEQKFLDEYIKSDITSWEDLDQASIIKWAKKLSTSVSP